MNDSIQTIPLLNLALAFVPAACVIAILYRWSLGFRTALYGMSRMLVQLLIIGYVLAFIFEAERAWIVLGVLAVMVFAASWIALRTVEGARLQLYRYSLVSILVGGGLTLALVTQGVLDLEPWFHAQYVIPLAGMIFAVAMNSVSLAAERLAAEMKRDVPYEEARGIALNAALIPITNSLFAVGLVSLPGMMTGQILSGVSPLIAARYQIMVMCMMFGSAGISTACFLVLARGHSETIVAQKTAS
jgi:putative ABC transport system permease protein